MNKHIHDVETPALVIDEAIARANIDAFQTHCDSRGLNVRPHIKTHKSIRFARQQLDVGAIGITCQKISEAEVMADSGVSDLLITFNILGATKLRRLGKLLKRVNRLTVTADNATVIEGLSDSFTDPKNPLYVMVECDTGGGRCGVQTPEQAVELARLIVQHSGLQFAGLMTYPAIGGALLAADFMKETKSKLAMLRIECLIVSSGGTPDMWSADTEEVFTEYRIGTYIYNDRSLITGGICEESNCAARVIATVVSRPTPTRIIIDAGSKVLTSDLLGLKGYGLVVGQPDVEIVSLSEEHGTLQVDQRNSLRPGDQIEIIPNHVCVVSNMFDHAWLIDERGKYLPLPIDARGCVL
ncbi:MAG: D-TA family PLP-dependent enzyme [Gammaproteobacteria bacterium]|nr:D-TA family PLP-dependent enzyme [Gammaproteobacteria bacterium]